MKKHLLLSSFILSSIAAFAQPTLSQGVIPTVGQVLNFHKAAYTNPGTAGASQTWNFGSLTSTGPQNFTVGLPSATPYASSFPNATLQWNDGTNFEFFSSTANDLSSEGVVDNIGTQPNTNAEKLWQFPVNFNSNYTDTWGGVMTVSSVTATRTASTTVTYDGYGTLTTPAGTFNNVARLHVVQAITDAASFLTVTRGNDEYRFYSPSHAGSLLTIYTRTNSLSGPVTGSMYQMVSPTTTVGMEEYSWNSNSIIAYPNPVSEVLYFDAILDRALSVELFDFHGKLIQSVVVNEGDSPVKVDVSNVSEGLYFARVNTVNGRTENKKILIRR